MSNTKEIAQKLYESGDLFRGEDYSLKQIFEIRDSCVMLAKYGLEDKDLLEETLKYIKEIIKEK